MPIVVDGKVLSFVRGTVSFRTQSRYRNSIDRLSTLAKEYGIEVYEVQGKKSFAYWRGPDSEVEKFKKDAGMMGGSIPGYAYLEEDPRSKEFKNG